MRFKKKDKDKIKKILSFISCTFSKPKGLHKPVKASTIQSEAIYSTGEKISNLTISNPSNVKHISQISFNNIGAATASTTQSSNPNSLLNGSLESSSLNANQKLFSNQILNLQNSSAAAATDNEKINININAPHIPIQKPTDIINTSLQASTCIQANDNTKNLTQFQNSSATTNTNAYCFSNPNANENNLNFQQQNLQDYTKMNNIQSISSDGVITTRSGIQTTIQDQKVNISTTTQSESKKAWQRIKKHLRPLTHNNGTTNTQQSSNNLLINSDVQEHLNDQNGEYPPSSNLSSSGPTSKSTFGNFIQNCQMSTDFPFVPKIIVVCCNSVEQNGLAQQGIYRVPGNDSIKKKMMEEINSSGKIDESDERFQDTNLAASLLKEFLRDLPDALITNAEYSNFIKVSKIVDDSERLVKTKEAIEKLPIHNKKTLAFLTRHLKKLSNHVETNKMTVENLATIFAPSLFQCKNQSQQKFLEDIKDINQQYRLLKCIILNVEYYFGEASLSEASQGNAIPQQVLLNDISSLVNPSLGTVEHTPATTTNTSFSNVLDDSSNNILLGCQTPGSDEILSGTPEFSRKSELSSNNESQNNLLNGLASANTTQNLLNSNVSNGSLLNNTDPLQETSLHLLLQGAAAAQQAAQVSTSNGKKNSSMLDVKTIIKKISSPNSDKRIWKSVKGQGKDIGFG